MTRQRTWWRTLHENEPDATAPTREPRIEISGAPTPPRALGEHGVIARVVQRLGEPGAHVLVGPGDDGAVLQVATGRVVVSTDVLVEGRHFRRDWSTPYDIGRKAAAQNLADIAAMGGTATALVVSLVAPDGVSVEDLEAIAEGLRDESALVGAHVVGGDLSAGDQLVLAVTVLGEVRAAPVTRAGARPGDVLVLAGSLGWSAAGLVALQAGTGCDDAAIAAVVSRHKRPAPPYSLGPGLADAGATALIDVSDGLLSELGHLALASGVRAVLDRDAVPLDPEVGRAAVALGRDPLAWLLTGGEDHALLAALPAGAELPAGVVAIGRVEEGSGVEVQPPVDLPDPGWDHFS